MQKFLIQGVVVTLFVPFLLAYGAVYLAGVIAQQATISPSVWYSVATLALVILGGGIVLFHVEMGSARLERAQAYITLCIGIILAVAAFFAAARGLIPMRQNAMIYLIDTLPFLGAAYFGTLMKMLIVKEH